MDQEHTGCPFRDGWYRGKSSFGCRKASLTLRPVAGPELLLADGQSGPLQQVQHPDGFTCIDHDPRHFRSINRTVCRVSAEPVSKPQQLALSRSESA
jgi:hypothetical protein